MDNYGYITFKSVSYAMKFETIIKNYDNILDIKIIPVPRSISSSCGLCIRFDLKDIDKLESIMAEEKLEYEKLYTKI